jgi:uncharacterized delta-60 repeat protein
MPYIIDSITAETINVNKILVSSYYNNGDSSSNTNIDWLNGNLQELNLDNDPTLTFSNAPQGLTSTLLLKQQLSGLRTITWPNDVVWKTNQPPVLKTIGGIGDFDFSFNAGGGFFNGVPVALLVQPDGKIILGGAFTAYSNSAPAINRMIRLNIDGTIDRAFAIGTGSSAGSIDALALLPDGKILIGGQLSSFNGVTTLTIGRLNSDGSLDTSFNTSSGANNGIFEIRPLNDGKILVGGTFTTMKGSTYNRFARLNSDGTLDTTFNIGTGFSSSVRKIRFYGNNFLIAGNFNTYNGITKRGIVLLDYNGNIVTSFDVGTGFNFAADIRAIAIQSDGKVLAGGSYFDYNGISANRIIRLNTDGSIDNTFVSGTGFNNTVFFIEIQSDGKIVVGGDFTTYNGVAASRIIRLNPDGSRDTTFNVGTGLSANNANNAVFQLNGNLLVVGNFTIYKNIPIPQFIASINTNTSFGYDKISFDYNGTYYIGSY